MLISVMFAQFNLEGILSYCLKYLLTRYIIFSLELIGHQTLNTKITENITYKLGYILCKKLKYVYNLCFIFLPYFVRTYRLVNIS